MGFCCKGLTWKTAISYAFDAPAFHRKEKQGKGESVASELQKYSDLGRFEQREAELKGQDKDLRRREADLQIREELLLKQRNVLKRKAEDPVMKVLERIRQREVELWEASWMDRLDEVLESEDEEEKAELGENRVVVDRSDDSLSPVAETSPEEEASPEEEMELQLHVDESDWGADLEDGEVQSDEENGGEKRKLPEEEEKCEEDTCLGGKEDISTPEMSPQIGCKPKIKAPRVEAPPASPHRDPEMHENFFVADCAYEGCGGGRGNMSVRGIPCGPGTPFRGGTRGFGNRFNGPVRGGGGGLHEVKQKAPLTGRELIDINKEVKRRMMELKAIQNDDGCGEDIEEFIKPFVREVAIRVLRKEDIRSMEEFLREELCCHRCFHASHVEQMCRAVCCDRPRCGKCFHEHAPSSTCGCGHTKKFLKQFYESVS